MIILFQTYEIFIINDILCFDKNQRSELIEEICSKRIRNYDQNKNSNEP